jgi:hypothetical protein
VSVALRLQFRLPQRLDVERLDPALVQHGASLPPLRGRPRSSP